ncbi:MAG: septum site-determining protein MinD [Candidatus Aenigmatarchaeota archaeon]|nr:MAG: septum site-determining protein MinD [Candidatus Aenigmarchaeota archaeon]
MTRVIAVASGKGGVGKTTTVSNLGSLLTKAGKNVTIVDGNLTTPNLSLHLGIPLYPTTLHDVLRGEAYITEALYIHPSGVRIVPAGLSLEDIHNTDSSYLGQALLDLLGNTDIILMDTSAGLGRETLAALRASDEMILVTNPDLPSVTDALKAKKLAEEMGLNVLGVVINRVKKSKNQLTEDEIREMLDGLPVLAKIPEDESIPESINMKTPVVNHKPNSPASRAFHELARKIIEEEFELRERGSGFFSRILDWLRGK